MKQAVESDVAWIGYANRDIQAQIEPALRHVLLERGLIEDALLPLCISR